MNLNIIDKCLNIIKKKSNPEMWNETFFDKISDYLVDIIGNYGYSSINTLVSVNGNYIEIRPNEKKDISNNWNCYPVYEITYYPKEDSINYIIEKRSYVNLNKDRIPDVSIYSTSEIYNSDGVREYFSKYYDMFALKKKISLAEFIDKTDVHYENGRFMSGPKIKKNPEISKEFRFQRTNVMLETTIIDDLEETYLDLTLDDDNNERIKLARKMNGNYYDNDNLIDDNLYRIVDSIDRLYQQCSINYSEDEFLQLFHKYAQDKKRHK